MCDHFWPKPLEAEGDMQTDNDAARSEQYCRNRITSADKNSADNEEDVVVDEEADDNNE